MIRVDGSNGIADIIVGAAIAVWIKRKLSVGEISLAMLVDIGGDGLCYCRAEAPQSTSH